MLRSFSSFCLVALAAGSLLGCKKDCATPQPSCYSGTVVATTCMLGVLVDVDPAYPIGARAVSIVGNRFLGNNVVAVANSATLGNLGQVGQQLHFTYTKTSAPTTPTMTCLAADGTTTPVPFVTLSNISTMSCDSVRAK
ncbi:hypothetical protein KB206_14145 [Microvirga sp. STS02]|uniref:hypothetical protein n=1 Tax=Hymenobacter negativus TaxID=2795026 RepID=UPI0018DD5B1C|nr:MULTISPECIES: hypothetical protein [Bacteria]MBH8570027.1 hypothetical protein [Hymenobacter negativus]MBR7209767.1 hypothetical protein [Microvirga sp. STS02]